ncbi:MAG: peptidoglycan editing factor PgeF [Blastocatellia bacterium]
MSTPIPTIISRKTETAPAGFAMRGYGDVRYIVCEPLEQAGFKNAFSTRLGGVSPLPENALSLGNFTLCRDGDQREAVLENRLRMQAVMDATEWPMVTAKQIHSADVRVVADYEDARREARVCDALTANTAGILLAIQTADCLPVLIVDPETKSFAGAHAGWRGTLAGIVARTVARMQSEYGSRPAALLAALGPAICQGCFEVGPEVLAAFRERYAYANDLITGEGGADGKGYLNINQANARQLQDCGVPVDQIFDSGYCTICRNDLFFSYRAERGAERHVGRLMSLVGVTP